MKVKYFAYFAILLLALIGCTEKEIILTQEHLENATLANFAISEELANQVEYVFEKTVFIITNLRVQEVNSSGIIYFFLETDTKNKQLLVVLNEDLSKVQWGEYYTEYCYFDSEELVAFVVEPFFERHQKALLKIYDFTIDHFLDFEVDLEFPLGSNEGDKQAYYQIPVYEKLKSKSNTSWYKIYWKQAHYSFRDDSYSLTDKFRGGITTSSDFSTLDELNPLPNPSNNWTIPTGYAAIAGNTNANYDVVFIAPEGENPNWENCEILYYNKETEETMQVLFASVFRYQDELLGVAPAQNKDERVAFIVETKEFTYDFYFDPAGVTTDVFLRPSSYVRLYPK